MISDQEPGGELLLLLFTVAANVSPAALLEKMSALILLLPLLLLFLLLHSVVRRQQVASYPDGPCFCISCQGATTFQRKRAIWPVNSFCTCNYLSSLFLSCMWSALTWTTFPPLRLSSRFFCALSGADEKKWSEYAGRKSERHVSGVPLTRVPLTRSTINQLHLRLSTLYTSTIVIDSDGDSEVGSKSVHTCKC